MPDKRVPDISPNEDKIVRILDTFYPLAKNYTSYSNDGKYLIRKVQDGLIEVLESDQDVLFNIANSNMGPAMRLGAIKKMKELIKNGKNVKKWTRMLEEVIQREADLEVFIALGEALGAGYKAGAPVGITEEWFIAKLHVGKGSIRSGMVKMIQGVIESEKGGEKWVRMLEEMIHRETDPEVFIALGEALGAGYKAGAPVGLTEAVIKANLNTGNGIENWGVRLAAVKMIQGLIEGRIAVAKWVRILEERFKVETERDVLGAVVEALAAGYKAGAPVGLTEAVIKANLNTGTGVENWGVRLAVVKMIQGLIESRIAVAKWVRILEERFKVETERDVLGAVVEALAAGYKEGASVGLIDAGIKERLNTGNGIESRRVRLAAAKVAQRLIEREKRDEGWVGLIESRIAVAKWVRILEERFKVETDPEVLIALAEALAAGYKAGAPVGLTEAVIKTNLNTGNGVENWGVR
ncbi:MAG: hypothetical protein AB1650_03930 [Candidatus Omnitrophota bacterium]